MVEIALLVMSAGHLDQRRVEFYVANPGVAGLVLVYDDPMIGEMILVTGRHRVEAAKRRGETHVAAVVEAGTRAKATRYRDDRLRLPHDEWFGSEPLAEHYADVVCSSPGRCWRMVQSAGVGSPEHCPESVTWTGTALLGDGRRVSVWSCDGHRGGVEEAQRLH